MFFLNLNTSMYICILVNLAGAVIVKNEVNSSASWTVFYEKGLCRTYCSNKKERSYTPTFIRLYHIKKFRALSPVLAVSWRQASIPSLRNLRNCVEVKLDLVLKELCLKRGLRAGEQREDNWDIQDWKENWPRSGTGTALTHFTLLFLTCVEQVKLMFYELT